MTPTGEHSMRVSSLDEYIRIEPLDDPDELKLAHAKFPWQVVVECDFPEWDVATRWCWQNLGPRDGECWSQPQYACCPLILQTEYTDKVTVRGREYELKRYSNVPVHHHAGNWTTLWFGKTEYDHGYGEFCFSSEGDKNRFLDFIPQVDWGENFPWSKK